MMNTITKGRWNASGKKIAVITTRWNELITNRLLEGAISSYERYGGDRECLLQVLVPGSVEIPLAAKKLAQSGKYEGIVALGCIVQGETDHHTQVSGFAANALNSIHLEYEIPVGLGILTVKNFEQAFDRAGGKQGNKGEEAMTAVIEMINLFSEDAFKS